MATRKRIDWEAVERDYRTGRWTLRELEAKHNVSYAEISRVAKRDAWRKDLAEEIRVATGAALLREHITAAQNDITSVVLVQAEVNKAVILDHRSRLAALVKDAETARDKVIALADTVADVREAAVLVSAIEGLGRVTKLLIEKQRENYKLDEPAPKEDDVSQLSDEELERRIAAFNAARGA